jgi:SPP1 gp7 family putative phage head morphogenesis protein
MAGKVTSLEGKVPKSQPPLQVVSLDGASAAFLGVKAERYNPDLLAARKGGLGIYKKMLQDEQVKAVMKFRRDSIIGRGHEFVFDETELSGDEQKKRVKVMAETLRRMNGSFADAVTGILTGMAYGFSVSEMVTQIIKIDSAPYVGIADILVRDAESFKFYTDDYGTLTRMTQCVNAREIDLDPVRFLHYVQNPEVDPYYGESELRAAYRPWFFKDMDLKLWAAYKERMAGGFLAIELGTSGIIPNSNDYLELTRVLSNMRSTMGVLLPNGVKAEMHSPASTDVFEKAITVHDLAIAKSLLVPNLLGMSQAGQTGSYAQSQTQLETYFMTLATDTQRLEQCLNDQMFRVLAAQNWDDGEFPRFRFKRASAEHVKWVVDSVVALSGAGGIILTPKDEAHLRQLLDLAPRDDSEDAMAKVKQDMVPIQEDPNKMAALAAKADAGDAASTPAGFTDEDARRVFSELDAARESPQPAAATIPQFSLDRALQRVDFAVIAQRTLGIEEDIAANLANIAAKTVAQQMTEERLTALLGPDVDTIGQVRIDDAGIGKIKAAFKDGLSRAWALGLNQSMTETAKARKATFSKSDRQLHFAALRENAADWFESNAFRMAGNFTDGMRAIIQQELLQAVKTGLRPEPAAARIFTRLIERGFMTLDAVHANETRDQVLDLVTEALRESIGTANVAAYLNTLVRTNTFEALNEARYAEFTDPAVADFVEALQYSAILDDRTTPICRELDGHVHAVGSKVWDTYRPPNHFQCRSILFAVTKLDGWDGQESPEPTIEPQEGFK